MKYRNHRIIRQRQRQRLGSRQAPPRAKRYSCYIAFGCLARDATWPGHLFNRQVPVGPQGSVVDVHWKQRNVRGMFPGSENLTTTIYDILDEYVERFGWDRVSPVVQTEIGNIAMSAVQSA